MSRTAIIDTGSFQLNVITAMFRELQRDLRGKGCVSDDLPPPDGIHSSVELATIRKRELQVEARDYLDSENFCWWANVMSTDAETLRERLIHG
ncbi:hypothetical protein LCGC14_0423220 [marine sediment metagenome]|uniref:Uncharacterized protein n=1 Tax=marine sediment metagenome TaxID=412755 RepID=A0A0F9SW78_9ZZZZ